MSKELNGKVFTGTVISDKMQDTIVVLVTRRVAHPVYKKVITRTTKIKAHDPKQEAKIGDRVKVQETRPISKTKACVLVEVLEKAN